MGIAGEVGFEVGGRLAQGGGLMHMAIQGTFDEMRARREAGVDSVSRLAMRLQDARRAQHTAERRAATAEAKLGAAAAELHALRVALRQERRLTAGLREAIGV